jgi:hypothetical protein
MMKSGLDRAVLSGPPHCLLILFWLLASAPLVTAGAVSIAGVMPLHFLPSHVARYLYAAAAVVVLAAPIAALFLMPRLKLGLAGVLGFVATWLLCVAPVAIFWFAFLVCMFAGSACE